MKKNLVILTRTRDWENTSWKDCFLIDADKSVTDTATENTLKNAIKEFLETEEGIKAIENSSFDFNWGDFISYSCNDFFRERGIEILSDDEEFSSVGIRYVDVEQDEVLC